MDRHNKNFFALCAMLESSGRRAKRLSPAQLTASGIIRHQIWPIVRAGFETYPKKTVDEILDLCERAAIDVLAPIIKD
jgi:hypothetical protein